MLQHSLKCTKNTESKNPKVSKTTNEKIMLLSRVQCVVAKTQDLSKKKRQVKC